MEPWREELYHYGVKGMKWHHKQNDQLSAEEKASSARSWENAVRARAERNIQKNLKKTGKNQSREPIRSAYVHAARAVNSNRQARGRGYISLFLDSKAGGNPNKIVAKRRKR